MTTAPDPGLEPPRSPADLFFSFNRLALQRLLEAGMAVERPTYGIVYCAMTSVDLHGVMLRAGLEAAERG